MLGASERTQGVVTPLLRAHKSPVILNEKFSGKVSRTQLETSSSAEVESKVTGFWPDFLFILPEARIKIRY